MPPLILGSLFTGIGGFDLAARRCGIPVAFMCEIDPFCRAVLCKQFGCLPVERLGPEELIMYLVQWRAWRPGNIPPPTILYGDVKTFAADCWRGIVSILAGGYPCQPESHAGQRRGAADDRWLWPEMRRVYCAVRPRWLVGENVYGHVSLGLDGVLADLEADGYETWPLVIPAVGAGACHQRDRVWVIAHADAGQRQRPEPALRAGRDAPEPGRAAAAHAVGALGKGPARHLIGSKTKSGKGIGDDGAAAAHSTGQPVRPAAPERCEAGPEPGLFGAVAPHADGLGREHGQSGQQPQGQANQPAHPAQAVTAHAHGLGRGQQPGLLPQSGGPQYPRAGGETWWPTEPALCAPDDGLSARLVRRDGGGRVRGWRSKTLRAAGNALVPQVPEVLFGLMLEIEENGPENNGAPD